MSESTAPRKETPITVTVEAALDGFPITFSISGPTADVFPKIPQLLTWIKDHNGTPPTMRTTGPDTQAGPQAGPTVPAQSEICPIHHVRMSARTRNGETWYSHKAIRPDTHAEYWCRGSEQ